MRFREFLQRKVGVFSQVKPGGVTVNIEHIFFSRRVLEIQKEEN